MTTWARTDQTGAVHLFELRDDVVISWEECERPEPGVYCECCCCEVENGAERLPCADSNCVIKDCDACTDPTCPCCATVSLECLDEEPEG